METKNSPLSVKLADHDKERLKALGKARQRSPHWLARKAIAEYLDREEALERFRQESMTAWEDYQRDGRAVSHGKVMEWLSTWGDDLDAEAPSCE